MSLSTWLLSKSMAHFPFLPTTRNAIQHLGDRYSQPEKVQQETSEAAFSRVAWTETWVTGIPIHREPSSFPVPWRLFAGDSGWEFSHLPSPLVVQYVEIWSIWISCRTWPWAHRGRVMEDFAGRGSLRMLLLDLETLAKKVVLLAHSAR